MQILMVLESNFPPDTRVENEALSLRDAGHTVHIVSYSREEESKAFDWNGIQVHQFKIPKFIYKSSVGALKFPFYFNFWREILAELISTYPFDAVHIHDLPLAKLGYELKKRFGLKFILDLHENWPALLELSEHTKSILGRMLSTNTQWVRYEKKYTNLADQVIVVVEEAKSRISSLGVDPDKITVVSNTLNISEFDFPEQTKIQDKLILSYGGGVNYHRGLQYVLHAISKINKEADIEVWIIGDGRYLPRLKSLAEELNITSKIKFWGWQPREQLLKLISQSHLALIPHIKSKHTDNTVPHKLFQYMYAEIPILSSNCDPLSRIIHETGSGLIFQSGESEELAQLLTKLLDDPEMAVNYKNGKSWVEKKYNWAVDQERLIDIYS